MYGSFSCYLKELFTDYVEKLRENNEFGYVFVSARTFAVLYLDSKQFHSNFMVCFVDKLCITNFHYICYHISCLDVGLNKCKLLYVLLSY